MEFIRKDNIIELSNPGVTSQQVLSAWHHAGCQKWHHLFKNRTKLLFRRRVARVFFCFYDRNKKQK